MSTHRTLLSLACGAALSGVASSAAASPQDLFGYGARSEAMGLTGTSYAQGFEATYSNPAGLATVSQNQFTLGFSFHDFHVYVDDVENRLPNSRGLVIGLALPIPFGGKLRDVFAFGAGFFTPTNVVMQAEASYPEEINWLVLSRSQVVALQLALGVSFDRVVPGLRFGFGISGSANTVGKIEAGLNAASQFVSRTETQLTSNFAPIVGVRYERDRFALGATFHAVVESRIDMSIVVSDLPVVLPTLTLNALAQYDPAALAVEGAFMPNEHLRLVAGLRYRRWSVYEGQRTKTSVGSNLPPDPDFRDTVSPRVGVEWTHDVDRTTLAVRGGYAFEPTPAPTARTRQVRTAFGFPVDGLTQDVRFIDGHRHVLTSGFGASYRMEGEDAMHFDVDLAATLQVVQRREHEIPTETGTSPMESRGIIPGATVTLGVAW